MHYDAYTAPISNFIFEHYKSLTSFVLHCKERSKPNKKKFHSLCYEAFICSQKPT